MHGLDKQNLFELKPLPKAALTEDIVSDNAKLYNERTKSFHFKAIKQSRFPGKLVSFGSLPELNDFYLPDEEFSQFVSLPPQKNHLCEKSLSVIDSRDSSLISHMAGYIASSSSL